ncbi:MAG: ASCH domain-containing protein [Sarcina sp.]
MDSLFKEYLILIGRDEEKIEYDTWYFGDEEIVDELFELTVKEEKRATTSLHCLYEFEKEKLPKVDSFSVVTNFNGSKKCVIKIDKVTVLPFKDVTKEFAFREGEGDKSLKYWQEMHIKFFNKELEKYNKVFSEDMLVVCEEFTCVYK